MSSSCDLIVLKILECIADDTDSHVDQIRRRNFKHCLRELLPVLVDLLYNT